MLLQHLELHPGMMRRHRCVFRALETRLLPRPHRHQREPAHPAGADRHAGHLASASPGEGDRGEVEESEVVELIGEFLRNTVFQRLLDRVGRTPPIAPLKAAPSPCRTAKPRTDSSDHSASAR